MLKYLRENIDKLSKAQPHPADIKRGVAKSNLILFMGFVGAEYTDKVTPEIIAKMFLSVILLGNHQKTDVSQILTSTPSDDFQDEEPALRLGKIMSLGIKDKLTPSQLRTMIDIIDTTITEKGVSKDDIYRTVKRYLSFK